MMMSPDRSNATARTPAHTIGTLIACALLISACSSPVSSDAAKVTLDPSIAKTQASALTTAVASASSDDGAGVLDALAQVADASVGLSASDSGATRPQVGRHGASNACTCTEGATSCTFSGCKLGATVVHGTVSWGDGTLSCDNLELTVPASGAIGAAEVALDCSLTYATGTTSKIAGSLHATGSASIQNVDYTWDATVKVNDVTFTKSAFTGGSVDLDATLTDKTSTGGLETYTGSVVVALP